jgi:hypothetical protein
MLLTSPSPATPVLSTSPPPSQRHRHSRRSAYRTRCGPACCYRGQPCPLVWAMTWSAGASASPSTSTASGSLTHVGLGQCWQAHPPAACPNIVPPISPLPPFLLLALRAPAYAANPAQRRGDVLASQRALLDTAADPRLCVVFPPWFSLPFLFADSTTHLFFLFSVSFARAPLTRLPSPF